MRLGWSVGFLVVVSMWSFGCDRIEALKDDLLGGSESKAGDENPELVAIQGLHEAGQYDACVQRAGALAASSPSMTDAFYYQGVCLLATAGEPSPQAPLSETEQASLDALNRALAASPRHALSNIAIGDLWSRRVPSRRPRGKADDPENPYTLAREAYERAIAIDPGLPEAQRAYAVFLERTGDIEAAEAAYKAAVEAAATVPEIAPDYYLAYGRFLAGPADRLNEALDQFELAAMFRQDDAAIQQEMAVVHARVGLGHLDRQEYLLAEEALKRADAMFTDRSAPEAEKTAKALSELRAIRRR